MSKVKSKCKQIDGLCMNPFCINPYYRLEAHHIIHKSLNGPDEVKNLIALCHKCHRKIEDGIIDIYYDILIYWINKEEWRWSWALEELKKRPKYYGL